MKPAKIKDQIDPLIKSYHGRILLGSPHEVHIIFDSPMMALNCANRIKINFHNEPYGSAIRLALVSSPTDHQSSIDLYDSLTRESEILAISGGTGAIKINKLCYTLLEREEIDAVSENSCVEVLTTADEKCLRKLFEFSEQNLTNPRFCATELASLSGMSRAGLFRKIKQLSGYSPAWFIREIRLKKALQLLEEGNDPVAQVAFATGFNNPSYFSKIFYERYNVLPSEYLKAMPFAK